MLCEWIVSTTHEGTTSPMFYVYVEIIDFQLERGYDFLTIGSGNSSLLSESTLVKLTGEQKLLSVSVQNPITWMVFETDRSGGRRGFVITLGQKPLVEYGRLERSLLKKCV